MNSQQHNLMHVNSQNLGNMDSLVEYQRLTINNRIGEYLKTHSVNMKKNEVLHLKEKDLVKVWKKLESKYESYMTNESNLLLLDDNFIAECWWIYSSSHHGFNLNVSSSSIDKCLQYIDEIKETLKEFLVDEDVVEYSILQYQNGETLNETFYHDTLDIDFNPLAVPFIDDVDKYINNFLDSKAPLLILQGEPGTGKTTFSKQILKTLKKRVLQKESHFKALYSFDESVFVISDFYKKIIYDDYDVLVLEDINQVIHKNEDIKGEFNTINKFLSVTDGLISKYKKIIITTNIDSKHQLNTALIRPGRCFDVLNFRKLEGGEIDNLCDNCAQELDLQIESINLSEFYAKCSDEQNSNITNSKIGF